MSIYATLWEIQIARYPHKILLTVEDLLKKEWVEVYAQSVPAHIGQPSEGYEEDYYRDFLPPIVEPYDPEGENPYRAVVIVQRGFDRKEGQCYPEALWTMTGEAYENYKFHEILREIEKRLR